MKTLQELEERLGARLVERGRGGARLTAKGRVFMPRAAACLAELGRAVEALAELRVEIRLRVGALPTVSARLAPQAVEAFRAQAEGAVVHLVTGPNDYLLARLAAGELDVVIGRLGAPAEMTELSFVHLYSEPVRFVVRPGHPLLAVPDLTRLAEFPMLLPDPGAVIRRSVDRLLLTLGVWAPRDRIETVSTSFGRAYVRQTDAVWAISHGVVAQDLEGGLLAALPIPIEDTMGAVSATTRLSPEPGPALRLFLNCVAEAARPLRGAAL